MIFWDWSQAEKLQRGDDLRIRVVRRIKHWTVMMQKFKNIFEVNLKTNQNDWQCLSNKFYDVPNFFPLGFSLLFNCERIFDFFSNEKSPASLYVPTIPLVHSASINAFSLQIQMHDMFLSCVNWALFSWIFFRCQQKTATVMGILLPWIYSFHFAFQWSLNHNNLNVKREFHLPLSI